MIWLKNGESCLDHVRKCLSNIDRHADRNAFVEVFREGALERARQLDQQSHEGRRMGRLYGAVVSLKDVIAYKGHRLSACSHMLEGYVSSYSATVTERLLAEDAIIIGRTNCDEFAMGSDNRSSYYGAVTNHLDPTRVPGGSSGGAAVSVQIGGCDVAIGSDTGGSVRQPASFCGLIGLKPTYGSVSRHGLISYGSSLDQIGFIGSDHNQILAVFDVVKGQDAFDSTLVDVPDQESTSPSDNLRVAVLANAVKHPSLDSEIARSIGQLTSKWGAGGIEITNVNLEHLDYVVPTYYVLASAEASSNLSRYDGVRYGYRHENATSLDSMYEKSRTVGFGEEVKRRILLGTFVLSYGYYDQFFGKAQRVRRLIRDNLTNILAEADVVVLPMSPSVAWPLDQEMSPVEIYLADIYSVLANLAGLPAISIPFGIHSNGMPYGIQVIGHSFEEKKLIFDSQKIMETTSDR